MSELVLKVEACGLTDMDLKVLRGEIPSEGSQQGSQIVGTVQKVDADITEYAEGDRIMVSGYRACGTCRYCRSGRSNECTDRKMYGIELPGGMAGEGW